MMIAKTFRLFLLARAAKAAKNKPKLEPGQEKRNEVHSAFRKLKAQSDPRVPMQAQNAIQYLGEWPALDGYKFKGEGWCVNSQGEHYSYETVGDGSGLTVQQCGKECMAKYAPNTRFVGINFHPSFFPTTNCNCMFDMDGTKGEISDGNGYNEEACYGYVRDADKPADCAEGEEMCHDWYCASFCCDDDLGNNTEETCWDTETCAKIADGGCPCPDGEVKCGADPDWGYAGSCVAEIFCCDDTEEECWDTMTCAKIADGGCPCPDGKVKCGAEPDWGYTGYCTELCCDYYTEEECWDTMTCAKIADGGCPCADGEVKCYALPAWNYPGYCVAEDFCCDETEEVCWDTGTCAKIADGGCPCSDGLEKCHQDIDNNDPGWCTDLCCEEYCFTAEWELVCAAEDGTCPSGSGTYEAVKDSMLALIWSKGSSEEIHHFKYLEMKHGMMMSGGKAQLSLEWPTIQPEVIDLAHTIKDRVGKQLMNENNKKAKKQIGRFSVKGVEYVADMK